MQKYVYIYLDPRKNGEFQYGKYLFEYEPFYVGKGTGNRYRHHITKNSESYNKKKFYKIKKIIKTTNEEPIVIKFSCKDDKSALLLEQELINLIGRDDLNEGPLTNLTDGGDGVSNVSEVTKEKLRSWKRTDEYKKQVSDTLKENGVSPKKSKDILKKISNKMKGNSNGEKKYIAISPEGNEIAILNLKEWCKENNFHYNTTLCVVHGRKKHYRNWKFTDQINNRTEIEKLKNIKPKRKNKRKNWIGILNGKEIIIDNLTQWCRENNYPLQRARWRLEHSKPL